MEKEDKEIPQRADSRGDLSAEGKDQKTDLGSSVFLGKVELKERQLQKIREKEILSESPRQTEFLPHT